MTANYMLFLPELYCLFMGLVLFCLTLTSSRRLIYPFAFWLSLFGVVAALLALTQEGRLFFEAYRVDLFSQIFKSLLAIALFLVVCICGQLKGVEERYHPEFYLFLTTCTLGMMLMVSAVELMAIYLALELSSFSLYILVPMRKGDDVDVEAGVKYLFIGATASAFMLLGLSYVFGLTHTTYVSQLLERLPALLDQPLALVGIILFMAGFFFKLAIFPFHFWAPDVYKGAANQVTTFIATASKVAAVALLIRITSLTEGSSGYLIQVLTGLSIASMFLGNMVAIVQKDLKRMLAYSAISHAGYVLIGVLTMSQFGYSSALFYTTAYVLMNFAAFMVVVLVASEGEDLKIEDLAGLHKRAPLLALTMMLALFSLAGIPPTVGFTGKFLLLASAMKQGYFWLVVIAMVNVTISLYYYLMVLKAAYLIEPKEPKPVIRIGLPIRLLNILLIVAIVYMGVFPQHFLGLANSAVKGIIVGS